MLSHTECFRTPREKNGPFFLFAGICGGDREKEQMYNELFSSKVSVDLEDGLFLILVVTHVYLAHIQI